MTETPSPDYLALMSTPSKANIRKLTALYRKTSAACAKSNDLLQQASALEREIFGTTRNDTDRDWLIDSLEYSSGGGGYEFTPEEVAEQWSEFITA